VTLGWSGTLLACAILTEATSGDPETSEPLRSCGDTVMWRVWDQLNCHVPLADAPPICHLGVAHGWSGMVYAAMRLCRATGQTLPGGRGSVAAGGGVGRTRRPRLSLAVADPHPQWAGDQRLHAGMVQWYGWLRDAGGNVG
jgi:hypothetical protein